MIKLKKLGHVLIRARDKERSRRFYTEVLGFRVSEELPGDAAFLTLGDGFHTFDIAQHPHPGIGRCRRRPTISASATSPFRSRATRRCATPTSRSWTTK